MPTDLVVDRRGALKARHRQAIVDAARRLIDARQGPRFSVDELAAEADLSRRTVFNHFESLDDVILAACTEILDAVVASFREAATGSARDGGPETVFEGIVHAVRSTDLPQLTAYLWRALGGAEAPAPRQQRFMQVALSRVADDLTVEVLRRTPSVDPLDAELLVSSFCTASRSSPGAGSRSSEARPLRPPDGRGTTSWTDSSPACGPATAPRR